MSPVPWHTHVHTQIQGQPPSEDPDTWGGAPPSWMCPTPPAPLSSWGAGHCLLRPERLQRGCLLRHGLWTGPTPGPHLGAWNPAPGLRETGLLWNSGGSLGNQTGAGWREGQVEGLQTDTQALVGQSVTLSESPPCR